MVEAALEAHGMADLPPTTVAFTFRDAHFTVERSGGRFRYTRTFTDSLGRAVRQVLANDTLYQHLDGRPDPLDEAERRRLETAVNSVVYFALLPLALADPAVRTRYLGAATVEGAPYHEVEVTFAPEGGGRDWEDRFVYWFHRERHTMDFLAYRYHTDGGGTRFRRAINPRTVGGLRLADYENYTADADTLFLAIERYDSLLAAGALRRVSSVALADVRVQTGAF